MMEKLHFFSWNVVLAGYIICLNVSAVLGFGLDIELGFPTGRDSATFWDQGTEVSSLSRDKGTTGQAQNLATGRDGMGFLTGCPVPSWNVPRDKITLKFGQFCCFLKKKIKNFFFLNLWFFFSIFAFFLTIFSQFSYWTCPGTSRDRGVCPGIFTPVLVQGQRDIGTRKYFCPGTKGQRDVPWKPYIEPKPK